MKRIYQASRKGFIMKLSMYLIADAWSGYSLTANIMDGGGTIEGVRFFTETSELFEANYVYVGSASHVIPDPYYKGAVLLAHRNDMIIVWNQEFEEVLNSLLVIFDRYNNWESTLWELSRSDDAIPKILKASERILRGPTYVADRFADILAISEYPSSNGSGRSWQTMSVKEAMPSEGLNKPIAGLAGDYEGGLSDEPRIYLDESGARYIGAHISIDDEPAVSVCVLEVDKEFNRGDLLVVASLRDVLASVFRSLDHSMVLTSRSMLGSILEGKLVDESRFEEFISALGIEKPWKLISIRNAVSSLRTERHLRIIRDKLLLKLTKELKAPSMGALFADDVVVLLSSSQLKAFLEELSSTILKDQYSIGISLPFYQQKDVFSRYRQTMFALAQCSSQAGIYRLEDFAYAHIISMLQAAGSDIELYHPALSLLENYDRLHQSKLHETLYCYLSHERNSVKAADELRIHRNTMRNRLLMIERLLPDIDLDDAKVRQHIILSYLIKNKALAG